MYLMHDQELKQLKRKIWKSSAWVLLAILGVLFVIVNTIALLAGNAFYREFCENNTRFELQRFESLEAQLAEGIKNKGWRNVEITSGFGYALKGTYLPSPTPSDKTIIFVHGVAANRLMGLWYAPMYLRNGYNVLIYDSRDSGESGGSNISWGHFEKQDLDKWVDWVETLQPGGVIGVHGVSMGAATALLHTELNEKNKRVKFYIADSAYSDLNQLLEQQIDATVQLHHTWWVKLLLQYSSLVASYKAGFSYQDVSPIHTIGQTTTPILFLHGEKDPLVPPRMCLALYQAGRGYKEKYIFPDDKHVMAIFNHNREYRQVVFNFIQQLKP